MSQAGPLMDDGEHQLHFAFLSQARGGFLSPLLLSDSSAEGCVYGWGNGIYVFVTCVFLLFRVTVESTLSEWRNSIGKSLYIYFYVGFHLDVGGKKSQKSK